MTQPKRYCLFLTGLEVIVSVPAVAVMMEARHDLHLALASGEGSFIAETSRRTYETFAFCTLHFLLLAFFLGSMFRRQPESPRLMWLFSAVGYSVLGIELLRLGVGVATSHTSEMVLDARPVFLCVILLLFVGWIVPSVILSFAIARHTPKSA
jgi:hypothetical protein